MGVAGRRRGGPGAPFGGAGSAAVARAGRRFGRDGDSGDGGSGDGGLGDGGERVMHREAAVGHRAGPNRE